MSDVPDSPTSPAQADTGETLARMGSYGEGKKPKKSTGGWGPLVLILVVLLPLAAVGAVAWLQMDMRKELKALRADNAALQQQSEGSTNQVAQLQQSQQQLGSSLEQELQDLQEKQQQTLQQTLQRELSSANAAVSAQAQRIAAVERGLSDLRNTATGPTTSLLSEAEAILRLARQRLLLAHDVAAAIDLYVAADEVLAPLDDPLVLSVREALARELVALRAVPTVDVSGLFAQLSAQGARVEELTVTSNVADGSATQAEAAVAASGWWSSVQQTIGEYFVVTRSTDAVMPQLNTEEEFLIRVLIQLRIEQAKLALLRADPQLYQRALDDALNSSRQWLNLDDANAGEFLAALQTLRDIPIVSDIPAFDETLRALRDTSGAPDIAPPAKPADPEPQPTAQESAAPGTQL